MLITRLVTIAVLLPLFLAALFFLPNRYWAGFLLPPLLIASLEWAALAGYRPAGRWVFGGTVLLGALALIFVFNDATSPARGAVMKSGLFPYWVSVIFWLVLAPAWLSRKWRVNNALLMGLTGCVVLLPAWLALVALQTAPEHLLMLLGVVWIADSAAYLVGRRFGRNRLAPTISPGKTWEGVLGAGVAVTVYYAAVWFIFAPQQPLLRGAGGVILFAVVTVMSVEGDLFESWMKRQAAVKDSGTLFPGHGGMLDRIDGLTASMPISVLLLHYIHSRGLI